MKQLSNSGQQAVNDIAQRHGFSPEAVASMLESVINGNGSMAQFNHPEFSGSGQWMRGGMTMVSDMFNGQLKGRVDALCAELSRLLAAIPEFLPEHPPAASAAQAPFPLQPEPQPRPGNPVAGDADIFLMIEKLADLRSRAIISDEDFNAKKTELLARL